MRWSGALGTPPNRKYVPTPYLMFVYTSIKGLGFERFRFWNKNIQEWTLWCALGSVNMRRKNAISCLQQAGQRNLFSQLCIVASHIVGQEGANLQQQTRLSPVVQTTAKRTSKPMSSGGRSLSCPKNRCDWDETKSKFRWIGQIIIEGDHKRKEGRFGWHIYGRHSFD